VRRLSLPCLACAAVLLANCTASRPPGGASAAGGDPQRGRMLVSQVGCGACHEIPGLRSARGLVGPPLLHMGRRTTIAGVLPNTPESMARWVQHPQAFVARNAMPEMGLSEAQARDVTAYLESLE